MRALLTPRVSAMLTSALLFVAVVLGLFFLELSPPGQQLFVQPWNSALAMVAGTVVRLFDPSVAVQGAMLASSSSGFALALLPGCNGVEATIVLVAAMLAFVSGWKRRLAGVALGLAAIPALNVVLVVGFFLLGQWQRPWYEWAGLYLWQMLLMFAAFAIWALWASSGRREVLKFLGGTLLALPVALVLWYFTAPFFDDVAARIAKPAIRAATDGKVTDSSFRHRNVILSVQVHAPYQMYKRARPPAIADIEVNASVYTVGLALFLALSAALKLSRRPGRIAVGWLALVFIPAWGVAFDVLKQLGATPAMASYLVWSPGMREAVALGYQLGVLLLPTLAPILLWLVINREWLAPVAIAPAGEDAASP